MSKPLCTVLIPFDASGRARFAALEQIASELGFQTMRVAQYYSSGMILEEIVRSICDAHLIIADLTRAIQLRPGDGDLLPPGPRVLSPR